MNNQYDRSPPSYDPFAFAYRPSGEQPQPSAPLESYYIPSPPAAAPAFTNTCDNNSSICTNNGGEQLIDLLDTPTTPSPVNMLVELHASPPLMITEKEVNYEDLTTIPADLLASQQGILDEIRRRKEMEQNDRAIARALYRSLNNTVVPYHNSRALTTTSTRVPSSYYYPHGSTGTTTLTTTDAVHPRKMEMKQARPVKTALGTAGGVVVGGLAMAPVFPIGMLLGGVAGGVATRQACKAGEKRAQRKWEQSSFQRGTESSPVAVHLETEGTGLV